MAEIVIFYYKIFKLLFWGWGGQNLGKNLLIFELQGLESLHNNVKSYQNPHPFGNISDPELQGPVV